jgi:hypothetical protein
MQSIVYIVSVFPGEVNDFRILAMSCAPPGWLWRAAACEAVKNE